jgi:hypothetical protein
MKALDISGHRFGRLTAISVSRSSSQGRFWLCKCDCGKECVVVLGNLRRGKARSCGCLHRDVMSAMLRAHGHAPRSGLSRTYVSWYAMLTRCDNAKQKTYGYYGGRGISVCDRWRSFDSFLADMGERPSGLSLDRIDPDGDYTKANCRWATRQMQSTNRRWGR